jgi:RNA polymerase sigma factor (sigma-70 family)
MNESQFQERLAELRPKLHRYCARMVGSTVDGEDVLQEALMKAIRARKSGASVDNLDGWLFRIAHNASLDFLRARRRVNEVLLPAEMEAPSPPNGESIAVGFRTFLRLPAPQRCAVILKDVLGHSAEEIADITGSSVPSVRSALQRGRANLRRFATEPEDTRVPLMSPDDRERLISYVTLFRNGDFDTIRAMLSDDVELELVNRLKLAGKEKIVVYFSRYAEESKWRFGFGSIEGRPAMLVFDGVGREDAPSHFVLIEWKENRIASIRDFLFAPYAMEELEWAQLW